MTMSSSLAAAAAVAALLTGPAAAQIAWDKDGRDADADGLFSLDEFREGFREWGTFGAFDADGSLTEDELTDRIFALHDDDGTGFIEKPELTDIGDERGDEGVWDV